jgi:hypothetical protein
MKYVLHIGIFIAVLIVYLHVQAHFRSAPSSDVFELDGIIDTRIDDVLDLKQPVIFRSRTCEKLVQDMNIHAILRDIGTTTVDVFVSPVSSTSCSSKNTRVAVSLDSFVKLQQVDISMNKEKEDTDTAVQGHKTNTSYYSDGNDKLINGLSKETKNIISAHHTHIAPPMTCTTRYDMLFGTDYSTTTMRRHVAHRTYFTVTNGTMEAKLIHPDQLNDVVFVSDPDMIPDPMTSIMIDDDGSGSTQVTNKYKGVAKEVTIYTGQTLYVPPYWGVILQFSRNTFVLAAKYSTYMTEIATCSHQAQFWYHKLTARPTVIPDTHVPKSTVATTVAVEAELEPGIGTAVDTPDTEPVTNDTSETIEITETSTTIDDT